MNDIVQAWDIGLEYALQLHVAIIRARRQQLCSRAPSRVAQSCDEAGTYFRAYFLGSR